MRLKRSTFFITAVAATLSLAFAGANARAGTMNFVVNIDTSAYTGISGDIEFQLGTAGDNVPITATFTNYSSDAMLSGTTINFNPGAAPNATVSGQLDLNTLTLFNDDSAAQIADADQLIGNFGTTISFLVTLSGDGIGAASASSPVLAISLFDSAVNPLYSGPPETNYAAAFFQVNTDGTVTQTNYPSIVPSPVPEPSTLVALASGSMVVGLTSLRRRKGA